MSREDIAALTQVLRMHFSENRIDYFVQEEYTEFEKDAEGQLILDDDDHQPIPILSSIASRLKPKEAFNQALANLIHQKIMTDGYFISIEQLIESPGLRAQVTLSPGLTWEEMQTTWATIKNQPAALLQQPAQHIKVIQAYPELLLKYLPSYPDLLTLLADAPIYTHEKIISTVAHQLQQTIADSTQSDHCKRLLSQLVDFFDGEPDFIKKLPESLLQHREVAKTLVSKNGLFWSVLSQELQQDPEIRNLAITQNPILAAYMSAEARQKKLSTVLASLPEELRNRLISPSRSVIQAQAQLPIDVQIRQVLRLEAYAILTTHPELSTTDFLTYAPKLTPAMLYTAIEYRARHRLKPLPIIGQNKKTLSRLKTFWSTVHLKLPGNIFSDSPTMIRHKAQKESMNHANQHTPFTYLSQSKNWIQAFCQYQAYQIGDGRRSQHFKALLLALGKAVLWASAIYFFAYASILIYPIIFTFVDTIGLYFALLSIGLFIINLFLRNRVIGTITFIFFQIAILDFVFFQAGLHIVSYLLSQSLQYLRLAEDYVKQGWLAWRQSREIEDAAQQNWLDQTETIIARLTLLSEPASKQKAMILRQIKTLMDQEPDARSHPGLINKRYSIQYQQKNYQRSFAEVAACRRDADGQFNLKIHSHLSISGFFRIPTSSERCLVALQQEAQHDRLPLMA